MIKVKHEPKRFCLDKARTVSTTHIITHLKPLMGQYLFPAYSRILTAYKKLSMYVAGKG